MKKVVLPLVMLCLASASMRAQEEKSTDTGVNDFNKWSIDFGGGFSKTTGPFADPANSVDEFNLFHADLGFRYMFNTKFGFKVSGNYDVLNDRDDKFKTNVIGADIQGYANLGRIMNFETFTNRFNILGHTGIGARNFKVDDVMEDDGEWIGSFLIGLTAQYRISNRISLNADFTMINSFDHEHTWDGATYPTAPEQGFDSTLYNASIGLSIYLGKHEKHADWYIDEKPDALEEVENRLDELETMMNDTDKDGVPDYLDAEPNTITGVAVDSKGRSIDQNGNNIPDELETYVELKKQEAKNEVKQEIAAESKANLEDLINGGYVNVYFDFNRDTPNAQSVGGVNFLIKYLKENPSSSADVIGYADEIGNSAYNKDLSSRRAANVKKILVDAGIDASRLNIIGNGEDSNTGKSTQVRQTVRRVTFKLK